MANKNKYNALYYSKVTEMVESGLSAWRMLENIMDYFLSKGLRSKKARTLSVMGAVDASRIVNVTAIAASIEKANQVLTALKSARKPNQEAIKTWERIEASLRFVWSDAMIEVSTDGRYSFE